MLLVVPKNQRAPIYCAHAEADLATVAAWWPSDGYDILRVPDGSSVRTLNPRTGQSDEAPDEAVIVERPQASA